MEFKADWRVYNTRYGMGFTLFMGMLLFMIIRPISAGQGFMFFELFDKFFLSSFKITSIFLSVLLYGQIVCYLTTRSSTKLLRILEDKLVIIAFSNKTLSLNYSDISCLNYTQDIFKNFQFTLKNGEIKVVYASVKNKQQALELIQQKIRESQT